MDWRQLFIGILLLSIYCGCERERTSDKLEVRAIIKGVKHEDPAVRAWAVDEISKPCNDLAELLPLTYELLLTDPDVIVRRRCAVAIKQDRVGYFHRPESPVVAYALKSACMDVDEEVRCTVLYAMVFCWLPDDTLPAIFIARLKDPERRVKFAAADCIPSPDISPFGLFFY